MHGRRRNVQTVGKVAEARLAFGVIEQPREEFSLLLGAEDRHKQGDRLLFHKMNCTTHYVEVKQHEQDSSPYYLVRVYIWAVW